MRLNEPRKKRKCCDALRGSLGNASPVYGRVYGASTLAVTAYVNRWNQGKLTIPATDLGGIVKFLLARIAAVAKRTLRSRVIVLTCK